MSRRKRGRPPASSPLPEPAPAANEAPAFVPGRRWASWLTAAVSGTIGFLLGIASAFAGNLWWEQFKRPTIALEYALLYRERFIIDTIGKRIAFSVTRDLSTDCVAKRVTFEEPEATRVAEPPGWLFITIFAKNSGRSAATNLRIGMVLEPQLAGLTVYHSPHVTASLVTPPPGAHFLGQTILIDVLPPRTEASLTLSAPVDSVFFASLVSSRRPRIRWISQSSTETGSQAPAYRLKDGGLAISRESELASGLIEGDSIQFYEVVHGIYDPLDVAQGPRYPWWTRLPAAKLCATSLYAPEPQPTDTGRTAPRRE